MAVMQLVQVCPFLIKMRKMPLLHLDYIGLTKRAFESVGILKL
jgi:hypothetical protein